MCVGDYINSTWEYNKLTGDIHREIYPVFHSQIKSDPIGCKILNINVLNI